MTIDKRPLSRLALLPVASLFLGLAGCAASPTVVQPGSSASVSFTCLTPDKAVAVSTAKATDLAGEAKLSPLYLARPTSEPVTLEAGTGQAPVIGKKRPMEEEVLQQLRSRVIGLRSGETAGFKLTGQRNPDPKPAEDLLTMSLLRNRPKEMRLSVDTFSNKTGRTAKAGEPFNIDPAFPGTIESIENGEVIIRFKAAVGEKLPLFFGTGTIVDAGDHYEVPIVAKEGTVVRNGPLVGRIIKVDNKLATIDFSDPFGGETLDCSVTVNSVLPPKPAPVELPVAQTATDASKMEAMKMQLDKALAAATNSVDKVASIDLNAPLVAEGDLAYVKYTATTTDGEVFLTTEKDIAENAVIKKTAWFQIPQRYEAEAVTVGGKALLPVVGEALTGMKSGTKKRITVTAEQAFGNPVPEKIHQFAVSRTFPRTVSFSAEEFVKMTGVIPTVGKEVQLVPYFPAKVTSVMEREVKAEFQVVDGAEFDDTIGKTVVKVSDDKITTRLHPVIGAPFQIKDTVGRITGSDHKNFTVDLNHPLAGKSFVVDLELVSLTKAADLPKNAIVWQEDHDAGLALAKKEGKPTVLVLHAEWCGFCKKLFTESIPDPRIRALADRFTWVKVNSDKQTEYKQRYGQNSYPLTILFHADGTVAGTLDGYKEPAALRAALLELL